MALQQRLVNQRKKRRHQRRNGADKIEQPLAHADFVHDVAVHRLQDHREDAIYSEHAADGDAIEAHFLAQPQGVQAKAG